jgi:hypothetical protein
MWWTEHQPVPGTRRVGVLACGLAAQGVEGDGDDELGSNPAGDGGLPAGGDPGEHLGQGVARRCGAARGS